MELQIYIYTNTHTYALRAIPVASVTTRHQGPLACMSSPTAPGFQTQRPSHRLTPALELPGLAASSLPPEASPTPRPSITGFSQSSLPTIPRIPRFPALAPASGMVPPHPVQSERHSALPPQGPPPHRSLTVASSSLLSIRGYKVVDVRRALDNRSLMRMTMLHSPSSGPHFQSRAGGCRSQGLVAEALRPQHGPRFPLPGMRTHRAVGAPWGRGRRLLPAGVALSPPEPAGLGELPLGFPSSVFLRPGGASLWVSLTCTSFQKFLALPAFLSSQ